MTFETDTCNSCGNEIVQGRIGRPDVHRFSLPVEGEGEGSPQYTSYAYTLCTKCRRRIVDWVEEDGAPETRIDPVAIPQLAYEMQEFASEIAEMAHKIDSLATDASSSGGGSGWEKALSTEADDEYEVSFEVEVDPDDLDSMADLPISVGFDPDEEEVDPDDLDSMADLPISVGADPDEEEAQGEAAYKRGQRDMLANLLEETKTTTTPDDILLAAYDSAGIPDEIVDGVQTGVFGPEEGDDGG